MGILHASFLYDKQSFLILSPKLSGVRSARKQAQITNTYVLQNEAMNEV
jgi:hypothetical protein